MARNVVTAKAGETELIARRSLKGKVFQQSNGQVRTVNRLRPLHWDDNGALVDVDDTPQSADGGRTWTTPSTPYNLSWDSETLTLSYQSKKGGDVTVRLAALNAVPVSGPFPLPTLVGQDIKARVAPDLDIVLRVRSHGVEIYKILHSALAPQNLTWEVIEGDLSNITFKPLETRGRDNVNRSEARKQGDSLNRRRPIEMQHVKTPDDLARNPGKKTYSVTETFTGRTRLIDPQTRARSFVAEVEWPVEIDVTVNESVVSNNDDGYGTAGQWYISNLDNTATKNSGIRFQTVDVPQAATVTSATLTVNVIGASGTADSTLAGQAIDDAPEWTNATANDPDTMAATTATVTTPILATGIRAITVTTIIQEIVNRAGWAANNDLRLGWSDTGAMGVAYQAFEDYSAAGTAEPELEIIYTAGGRTTKNIRSWTHGVNSGMGYRMPV